mmetsp:Transcript_29011/g.61572  ORF Transcript_29011/g.61572 Transcript_29011/m.61572 type:complete len:83 (-) Transcript_29011:110-358(-)
MSRGLPGDLFGRDSIEGRLGWIVIFVIAPIKSKKQMEMTVCKKIIITGVGFMCISIFVKNKWHLRACEAMEDKLKVMSPDMQ